MKLVISNKNPIKSNPGWLRSKVSLMSDEYLAMLDRSGIKIIGLDYELSDTSWAGGEI